MDDSCPNTLQVGMDEAVDVQWDAITSYPLVFHKGETFHGKPF